MHLDSLCAAALVPHFQSRNLECSSVSGGCLSVPGLAMDFVASEGHGLLRWAVGSFRRAGEELFEGRDPPNICRHGGQRRICSSRCGVSMGDGRASRDRELHSSFSRVRSGEVANDRRSRRLTGALRLDRPSRASNRSCLWRVGLR